MRLGWNKASATELTQYIILAVIIVLFFVPVVWIIYASFEPTSGLSIQKAPLSLDSFKYVLSDGVSVNALKNSLIISLGQSIVSVTIGIITAYPLSRYQIKYKKQILLTILFLTGLPIVALMVPVYQLFSLLKIQNSIISTVFFMATASLPYNIWLLRSFMNAVPFSLEESARIDGATSLQIIFRVIIPLMASGIATVFIFTFTSSWGNFFVPYILLNSADKLPASVKIYEFFGEYGLVAYSRLAAFSILYTIPSVILYLYSQKFLTGGLTLAGADK